MQVARNSFSRCISNRPLFSVLNRSVFNLISNQLFNMEQHKVVPDVIDSTPDASVEIIYPANKQVNFGEELTPTDVKDEPMVSWTAEQNSYYTLAMVDPDAPSRTDRKLSEVKHWLVANILGSDVSSGEVIADYLGSGPPKGTGLHRYIFLVYKQPSKLNFDEPKSKKMSREHRLNFSIRNFAKKYNLGKPQFGNFYQAQWDPYVEIRNQNMST